MGAVVRLQPRSSAPKSGRVIRPVQFQNVSGRSRQSGQIPPLNQLLRDGRASHRRILDHETGILRFRKAVLIEWLDQAERLWIAAEAHKLKGKHFTVFASQIGIDRSSAYELLKLHPNRNEVTARCRSENKWPGWEVCAGWFKHDATTDVESEESTTRNRGMLTPSWQRFKVSDDEYGTPQALFDHYDHIYKFTCDVCATPTLTKCKHFYTPEQDGLKQVWRGVCWMNPPYGDRGIGKWVRKAYESGQQGAVVVALLPMFTDTAWFWDYATHASVELLRGRLQFDNRGDSGYSPLAHGIFVFRQKSARRRDRLTVILDGHRIGTRSAKPTDLN